MPAESVVKFGVGYFGGSKSAWECSPTGSATDRNAMTDRRVTHGNAEDMAKFLE